MTMNSTISELVQDNSNVTTETNPIATVQSNELIFGQKHNDIDCALCPTAKRACDRAWVTAKNLEEWSGMSKTTMWRRLSKLDEVGRICSVSDMKHCKMPTNNGGYQDVQLYNLNVLNQLAMVELDCPVLNDTSKKFSDILSEVETTGRFGMTQISRKDQLFLDIIHAESEDARVSALTELNEINKQEVKALEAAHDETKALLAEEKEKNEYLERSKSWIGDKKVASAMGTAGAKSKECDRLKKELDKMESEMELKIYNAREAVRKEYEESWVKARDWCYNHKITVKVNEPKWAVSAKLTQICETYPDRDQCRRDAHGTKLFPKWACDILDKMYDEDDTFLSEYRIE